MQVDFAIEHNLFFPSDRARACRDWLVQSHNRTATRVPTRPVVDSLPLRRKPRRLKRATGTFLRAGFRIHNHLPPKQKKDIPFGMSFCFGGRWWIRTTEVIDDRFTVWSIPAECLMISGVFPYYSLVHCFIPLTTIVLFDSFHLFSDLFSKTLLLIYCLFIAFRERI